MLLKNILNYVTHLEMFKERDHLLLIDTTVSTGGK